MTITIHNRVSPTHPQHKQAGLSLLELTIVFVIVGLLYGGVLKGYELIKTARIQATLQAVETYRNATQMFLSQYEALPGDYAQGEMLGKGLKSGNGDGIVSGDGLDDSAEAFWFWSHLVASGLIAGDGHPPHAKVGGVFTVEHNSQKRPGLWLVLGKPNDKKGQGALLTPQDAFIIDKKMGDTGKPTTGIVQAEKGEGGAGSCVSGDSYDLKDTEPSCIVYFKIF